MIKTTTIPYFMVCLLLLVSCASGTPESKEQEAKGEITPITPETALQHYLNNGDSTFRWEVKEQFKLGAATAYDLLLTSQQWREHIWTHQLTIIIPEAVAYDGALLFITGGSTKDGRPNWKAHDNDDANSFSLIAQKNKAIVAIIRQTPNQPLYDDLVEDQLISYTLHQFKKDNDFSWPLLFPMVKSAVKAMDAVQEFSEKELNKTVTRFTVAGASKRGWTTWLTGASDKRIEAIGPMVIDVLNMPVNLDYQLEAWKEYSVQIEDYTKLEIPQTANSPSGSALTQMIDPYFYREKLTIPKLIFIGTNDEYWPVDAVKNYISEIPGENYIHYVPNAGHDLNGGEQALRALSGFWGKALEKEPFNNLSYQLTTDKSTVTLSVKSTSGELVNAYLWIADSDDRDFRDEEFTAQKIKISDKGGSSHTVSFPEMGYKAFYIDLEFKDINGGEYTKSTRMYLVDDDEVL